MYCVFQEKLIYRIFNIYWFLFFTILYRYCVRDKKYIFLIKRGFFITELLGEITCSTKFLFFFTILVVRDREDWINLIYKMIKLDSIRPLALSVPNLVLFPAVSSPVHINKKYKKLMILDDPSLHERFHKSKIILKIS